ncbi:MAG: hypothetical protein NXI08_07630 [bacterium]|nr:hypothetical protein [bacterium]
MSKPGFLPTISLIVSSFLLSGCYTQLQSLDYSERASNRGIQSEYYSWNSDNENRKAKSGATNYSSNSTAIVSELKEEETDKVEIGEIYYKDYETAQWYEDNYADRLYWNGYDEGFSDGYSEGREDGYDEGYEDATHRYWDAHFYSLRSLTRRGYFRSSFHFSWRNHLAFSYYPYYYFDYYHRFNWAGYRYPYGGWVFFDDPFYDPFYDPFFYGGWGYHHRPYRNYVVFYNDYHKEVNRSRSGRIYDGPRSTGLLSRGNGGNDASVTRSRSGDNSIRSKTTGRTRTSGITNTNRTRGSETTRTRYTGRTNSSTSRSSGIVGRSRTKDASSSVKTNRTRRQDVTRTTTGRTRSSGVTNNSRGSRNSSGVRSGSTSTGRSSGVRSTGRSGGNNRSVRSSGGSSRSSGVRSSGSSSRSRSSGTSSSTTRKKRSGNN